MMNNDMLANIEYLREKADVSYEEAEQLLEQYDGNVMRVLVELERQGRVYPQPGACGEPRRSWEQQDKAKDCDGMKKTKSFLHKAMNTRLVVEKKQDDGERDMLANIPVPFAVIGAVCAPWLTVGTAVVAFATGHSARIKRDEDKKDEKDAGAE